MIKNLRFWFYLSLVEIVACVTIIVWLRPLLGTDFTGGSLLELAAAADKREEIAHVLTDQFRVAAVVQPTQEKTVLIRTVPLKEEQHQAIVKALRENKLIGDELRFETIGPTVGAELKRKALWASLLAVVGMIAYLAYAFRSGSRLVAPWKFGVAAVFALLHDTLFVTAFFVILGRTSGVVIDSLFITAMLSVMGYSVHDTIVIFDRLREEWLKARQEPFLSVLNRAVRLSFVRSMNTSLTILLVLLALLFVGGSSLRWFIVALTAGTVVGTYSSFLVASPCLYMLAQRKRQI